ncbi:hypothetical protein IMCC3317_44940 [Kordia antarctica]|uniref:Uncharacterized protein n=1 Tax=Kordia antarctica TaxID=1218801 RepID=A0A7L4ZQT9_9FLAO|nr:hypothetical protein [Kordia antarctica]QHI39093.1 hypothetical protein IMCC3317_44940 [Kordia antarctica]
METKQIAIFAKISLILLILLSALFAYNSVGNDWDFHGIPWIYINILNIISLLCLLIYFSVFSANTQGSLSVKSYITIGIIGSILYTLCAIIYLASTIEFGFDATTDLGLPIVVSNLVYTFSAILLTISIVEVSAFSAKNFQNISKLKSSFTLGIISSVIGTVYSLMSFLESFLGWQAFQQFNTDDINYYEILGIPTFILLLIEVVSFILLMLFFIKAYENVALIKDYFNSKKIVSYKDF